MNTQGNVPQALSPAPSSIHPPKPESGYALLFILMMAAAIAISLYSQLPRLAFEAQREKEQLLIDRGEQYKRGIQLYVRKFNRFPVDMQALENTQNIRFLRKQYVDPMTGKNEWRLIHVGPNGALIDSKVSANPGANAGKDKSAPDNFIADIPLVGSTSPNQAVNQAARRRPEDGGPADPYNPGSNSGTNSGANPGAGPGGYNGPVMVLPDGRIVPANSTGTAPTGPTGATGQAGGSPFPGQPGQPAFAGQPGVPGQAVTSGQSLGGGFQNTPNAPSGGAANLINQILTTPRPGGFNGLGSSDPTTGGAAQGNATGTLGGAPANNTGTPIGQGMGGTTVGGGIAGVASKYEQEGIKVYNQQTSYDLWEFIYDMSKDKSRGGGASVPQPQSGQAPQAGPSAAPLSGKS